MIIICGIIGFQSYNKVTSRDLEALITVLVMSQIRGKHASGIAWYDGNQIQSISKGVPMLELLKDFDISNIIVDGQIRMIGHTRYSTSDIKYNQPIIGNNSAIVHNGVISQADPSEWEELFGIKCTTRNDSELLLRAYESLYSNGEYPYGFEETLLDVFEGCSIATLIMDSKGDIFPYRNNLRPLWVGETENGFIWASTYDILNKAGVEHIVKVTRYDDKYEDMQSRSIKNWR